MHSSGARRTKLAVLLGVSTTLGLMALAAFDRARRSAGLPMPGHKKRDPVERDKMLDTALEDSMIASDPPAITQPDVKV
jgi:hypothetical protein